MRVHPLLPSGALALLLGAVAVTGFAPLHAWPVPLVTLAVLFWLAARLKPRQAFTLGWCYGLGLFGAGVSWVYVSLSLYGGLPVVLAAWATLLFAAFLALFPAWAVWLAVRLSVRLGAPGWVCVTLLLPACWALLEWVRGWFLTGFPWLALGYSQVPDGALAGFAPVLGVYGVGLLLALAAGLFASLRPRGIVAGLLLLLSGWGVQQVEWTHPVGPPVSVALLQGNVPQDMKFRSDRLEATLQGYARQVLASDARLVILPETALPLFRSAVPGDYLALLAGHVRQRQGDVLIGLPEDVPNGEYFNSVVSLGQAPEGNYRKHHLVPFGEFVPFGFRWLVEKMHIPLGDFSRGGAAQPPLAAAGQRLAVNVCFEDVFGEERIHAARQASLLVNVSNDAWFGNSLSPWQHLQIGAMRSLEAGRWQLRANNTGVTAILDAHGQVRAALPLFTPATLSGLAQGHTGLTPYLRWGNLPALTLIFGLLLAAFLISRKHLEPS